MNYQQRYAELRSEIERYLLSSVPADVPEPLGAAMRYSLMAGGKRLRAVLLLASYAELCGEIAAAVPFAVAVEMVHTYSLIHDDLPAMDNDDLRRGRETCHKVYGEGMAILAGDALLSLAFETMAESEHPYALAAMRELARRSGTRGMVAGQCADLNAEQHGGDSAVLHYIHLHKTADMLIAPVVMGLLLGGADASLVRKGHAFAENLGIAFQIMDDILDVEGDTQLLGKRTGKDIEANKCTWPSLFGLEQAKADAKAYTEAALRSLEDAQFPFIFHKMLAQHMLYRVQ